MVRSSARRRFLEASLRGLALFLALSAQPVSAQEQVKVGIGFGLGFLPVYICEDLKLIEKHAKALHLDVKASYQRYVGAGPMRAALAAGEIDMAPFGVAPLLAAWDKARGSAQQIFAVSGITSMPLTLVTNKPNLRALADFGSGDHIAIPSATAPQLYLLQMQAEKALGRYDRLDDRIVVLTPAEALNALAADSGEVSAYFASPPFSQLALRSGMHGVLTSTDIVGGKASLLIMGATRAAIEARPQLPEVVAKAMDEAARLIRTEPKRATQIYLTHEPSKTFDAATIEAALRDNKDEFGSAVYGIAAFAEFMGKHDELKRPPQSFKDVVAPALQNSPST
jgi:NitT/TauT family transport system substrate-binding protein